MHIATRFKLKHQSQKMTDLQAISDPNMHLNAFRRTGVCLFAAWLTVTITFATVVCGVAVTVQLHCLL